MSCFDNITDMKMEFSDGCENPAGIGEKAYWIPLDYFVEGGIKVPTAGTTAASLVTISGSHVLKAGKAPIPITMLYDKSGSNGTLVGEKTSKIGQGTLEAFVPGKISAHNLGTAKVMKNQRGIILFKSADGGTGFWQGGTEYLPVYVENIDKTFGTGPTGEKGIKITLNWYGTSEYWDYQGELPAPASGG